MTGAGITVCIDGVEHIGRISWPRTPLVVIVDVSCPRCGRDPLIVQGQGADARVDRPGSHYFVSFGPVARCCGASFDSIRATFEPSPPAKEGKRR